MSDVTNLCWSWVESLSPIRRDVDLRTMRFVNGFHSSQGQEWYRQFLWALAKGGHIDYPDKKAFGQLYRFDNEYKTDDPLFSKALLPPGFNLKLMLQILLETAPKLN